MKITDYHLNTHPLCRPEQIITGPHYRISILTDCLIRFEYAGDDIFEDRATQVVINRDFPEQEYRIEREEDGSGIRIRTRSLVITYDGGKFSSWGLSVFLNNGSHETWHYGDRGHNFGGTARTLDEADGEIPISDGLVSREGFAVLDDSKSMALTEDGWTAPRRKDHEDFYFWGYGRDIEREIRDYYHLTGLQPLLPRFALGNWWSRYHRYTQQEYEELIRRFERENIPFSVSIIDMDWHLTDIDPAYGTGWTGFTWNRELFPDPEGFLAFLHRHHLKTALNLHPAQGIAAHEFCYREAAVSLGMDPEKKETIPFQAENPAFLQTYFDVVLRPMEKQGVDFWWMDWQQGSKTSVEGLDPLWILNHFHYLVSGRNGGRKMIFSRFAGPGSHRYPIGFSGDTCITWDSLKFQPYFTATASNIGFGWWSHDIGGHMLGVRDDELETRWVQFGVFSPIMRLHSSDNPFTGKEPWNFNASACAVMKNYLRLRHQLIPYLYSMNWRSAHDGLPLIEPLYWKEPENELLTRDHSFRNEYYFGTELLVSPITDPMDRKAQLAEVKSWIPKGTWFDFFTGLAYRGGRVLNLYRGLENIPVLARAGAIIPMNGEEANLQSVENPDHLLVHVFPGAEGRFTLWEDLDDGAEDAFDDAAFASTEFALTEDEGRTVFRIGKTAGNLSAVPKKRDITVVFRSVQKMSPEPVPGHPECQTVYDDRKHTLTVLLKDVSPLEEVQIVFPGKLSIAPNPVNDLAFDMLLHAQTDNTIKTRIWRAMEESGEGALGEIAALSDNGTLTGALLELATAYPQ